MEKKKTYTEQSDQGKYIYANIISMKDLQILKWQRVSYLLVAITLISVLGLIFIATRATFIPYIISVDEKTGFATSLGSLKEVKHELTSAEINYFLSRFIEQTRSVPTDKFILQENIKRATRILSPESAKKFKDLYLSEFEKKIGSGTNRVEVLSITPVANVSNTYQARWKESFIGIGVSQVEEKTYTGIFSIEQKPINDEKILKDNPLGIFIIDFSMSEEGIDSNGRARR
mgnify:FL=1